jgi:nodulation protein E
LSRRVLITGLGCFSTFGPGAPRLWSALLAGRTGIGAIEDLPSDAAGRPLGAVVGDYDPRAYFPANELPLLDRFSQYALLSSEEAVSDAGLERKTLGAAALVLGTGCGGKETDEQTYVRLYRDGKSRVHPYTIPRGMPSAAVSQVSIRLGIRGPSFSVTSACASAAHAVAQAVLLIRSGCVDLALAGGTDAPFTAGLMRAWQALRVLSPDGCRPFSQDRNGLVLGEGAGMVVLESESHARARTVPAYAELAGVGMSSDAAHITDPSEEGAAAAMTAALADAGLTPHEVDYINAHGTGTLANDLTESRAIRRVFGARADRLAVSSTKGAHGHALGASGALELVATALAVHSQTIPSTVGFTAPGEGCDLDYVPERARKQPVGAALSNSFAFGGLNAVLALKAV